MTLTPYYERDGITLYHGDCREILPTLPKVDLVLTDPPYSISLPGVTHVGKPGNGSRRYDFFEGDGDWAAMTAVVLEALSLALDQLSDRGSFYAWCGHRQFGRIVDLVEARGLSSRPGSGSVSNPPPPTCAGGGLAYESAP